MIMVTCAVQLHNLFISQEYWVQLRLYCIPIGARVQTWWDGKWEVLGHLAFDLTMVCCTPQGRYVFHGEGFGVPRGIWCSILQWCFECPKGNLFSMERNLVCQSPKTGCFFVWTTVWGNILINDNLRKRTIILVDWCCLCRQSGEKVDHLLLHCNFTYAMWSAFWNSLGDAA